MLIALVDLAAAPDQAMLPGSSAADAGPRAIEVPGQARFPALLLNARTEEAQRSQADLVAVDLRRPALRVILTFPLASHGGGEPAFSTIMGPDLRKSKGEVLDIAVVQTALPDSPQDRPGPPTTFVCRFSGEEYACGR
ncbi:MAG: hypothetical protein HY744_27500 [Deltaproteobacteria bacterium]|nr:hypothetical protein [Deltaproteobacteria bacterium]